MKKTLCLLFMVASLKSAHANQQDRVYEQVASTIDSGMSARGLWAAAQIESHGNPNSVNGRYAGLINMGEAEFKKYGPPYGDRKDPLHNLMATAYYVKENAVVLKEILRRQPAEAELYISLQQGRRGMIELLRNPRQLAVKVRGHDAIVGNVPDDLKKKAEKWTCAQFVNYWTARFNDVAKGATV